MTDTPNLALPLLAAAQAQKHVTHNEALVAIDALLQCAVLDKDLASPPSSSAEAARFIVANSPTGAWAGHAGSIAARQDGAWRFYVPRAGHLAYVADETRLYVFDGTSWVTLASAIGSIQNLGLFGLGTVADAVNPFSAKLNAALWTARAASEGGTGDLRLALNKESAARTGSLLFETGYSGRLEIGLIGSDNPTWKVSPDGSTWRTALTIDPATGGIDLLASEATLASAATCDLGATLHLKVLISGAATITSLGTAAHAVRLLRFTGAATLVHDASTLVLPTGGNIVAAPGDTAIAVSDGSGQWRVVQFLRASGRALAGPASAEIADATTIGRSLLTTSSGATAASTIGLGTASNPTFAGATLGPYSPALLFQDSGGAPDQRRISILSYLGSLYVQFQNDDGSFRGNPLSIDATASSLTVSGTLKPNIDGGHDVGSASQRFGTAYFATGTINTSDAGDKTAVTPLSAAEIAAASDMAEAVGTFQFLDRVQTKGADRARRHAGLTVQSAMAILRAHGLDPFRYGFICQDSWDEVPPTEALVVPRENRPAETTCVLPARPGRAAGSRLGFRSDQLALFMARGEAASRRLLEARIAVLESRLGASPRLSP